MRFEAKNPEYAKAVRASFERQSFMRTLGARLEVVEPGRVEIAFSYDETLLQQDGYLHAGVATSCVDSACGYAALSLAPQGSEVLTSEFKIHFLRPAAGKSFRASGVVRKPGRLLTICEGEVVDLENEALIAKMSATMVIKQPL